MAAALVPELSVTDLGRSLAFYCDVLGFSVRYQRPAERFAYLALGAAELMLDQSGVGRDWVTAPLEPPLGRGVNFQIEVGAIAPVLGRLELADVPLFLPVETRSYARGADRVSQRQFCVQDPDGYLLRFFERS